MATTLVLNSLAALTAALGVGLASMSSASDPAYDGDALTRLTRAELAHNAWAEFDRADRDGDSVLSADEFAALAVVKAELAHLNGFISIEIDDNVHRINVPVPAPSALSEGEHARIDAVARHSFYAFAGKDGKMDADDYIQLSSAVFDNADRNNNKTLTHTELTAFASKHAGMSVGA